MRREWSPEDVVACWTPVGGDWDLVANKSGPTRLGFVLMLKFFELEGRFPRFVEEFPPTAVDYVAAVVKVPAEDLAKYDLSSRSAKGHRTQIREALVNTLLLQQVLADSKWAKKLTDEDRRGLTALFWSNVNPYGTFRLDMDKRLDLGLPVGVPRPRSAGTIAASVG
ncbi:DUF4158 domain-containing protein [Streptomyces sp. NPDC004227]